MPKLPSNQSDKTLERMLEQQRIPHALLFSGGGAVEKAEKFACDVICLSGEEQAKKIAAKAHPDLHVFFPEGKTALHPIKTIKDLSINACLSSFESEWKVFILHEAERMLPASANALLKILEEPPSHTLFLLVSKHPEKIIPTIRSRCQMIEFPTGQTDSSEILDLLTGKVAKEEFAKKYQETILQNSELQSVFFETFLLWFRDRMLLEMGEEARKYLHFPHLADVIRMSPLLPLEKVENFLKAAKTAFDRSIKLSSSLDYLFLNLFCK